MYISYTIICNLCFSFITVTVEFTLLLYLLTNLQIKYFRSHFVDVNLAYKNKTPLVTS